MDGSDKDEDKNTNDAYKALDINLDEWVLLKWANVEVHVM